LDCKEFEELKSAQIRAGKTDQEATKIVQQTQSHKTGLNQIRNTLAEIIRPCGSGVIFVVFIE